MAETTTATPVQAESAPTPALATTKRKFHRLLENLTKPQASKRAHDTLSTIDSPAKRIRLEARSRLEAQASSSQVPRTTQEQVQSRVQAQLLRTRLDAARSTPSLARERPDVPQREPNYVPWSFPAFLKRLQTFSNVRLWSSKPDAVNEVAWAKSGWICVDVNTVACKGGCEARVVVGLRPLRKDEQGEDIDGSEDFSVDVSEELVTRVAALVVEGHAQDCLWRGTGCRDDIYRLPIARQAVWQPELFHRYTSFSRVFSKLPPMANIICPADVARLVGLLPPDFRPETPTLPIQSDVSDSIPQDINDTALAFALTGWTISTEGSSEQPIATCTACFRRLGLWLYLQCTTSNPETSEREHNASMTLDLAASHRTYCPWINSDSQHMTTGSLAGLNGWQVLSKSIENAAGFRAAGDDRSRPSTARSRTDAPANGDAVAGETAITEGLQRPRSSTVASYASKSREELELEDKARFAKLRELTKSIGLKGLRAKLSRPSYH